ncbi:MULTISPECIES: AraC family transcriptional regulator [Pseudomonas]|jgi:AraC-like DNA-binding protein/quercetin dioxygenase-like cupin family protein|uniref:AraC family transcriptional regulator n=1 Tax=Pseudomonas TaxID=286 RepID=UPI00209DF61C|nr:MULTISPECIES: helix-turn-helix transcriptional regulator [Pseudomonas]MCP1513917.1 AraC-like DNA-binding protein/quercetin dioxygenase-like cupin family protein [Pseudomonas rhodesiae]MDF9772796.1 AraC-like DNA-binding protein/quercetin dioxygenase-like cupin family protein [Pseudomonas rhodesiae]WLH41157.1 helix-turn-helix transcriptional regulator [Pseudomonas sp. FP2254]
MQDVQRQSQEQFELDDLCQPAVALMLTTQQNDKEFPVHKHRKGQLVVACRGGIVCTVEDGVWMVPSGFGVWIPAGVAHSNRVTANGQVCFLLVEPEVAVLPKQCCTLVLSPLILELIFHLSEQDPAYPPDSPTARLTGVLLEQLEMARCEQLYLPLPAAAPLRAIARALAQDPSNRSTIGDWAREVAMSERSLARLVKSETGLTFGQWRRQWQLIVALQSLAEGESVQRTAEILGYESVSSFISMFRKTLGASPARYVRSTGMAKPAAVPTLVR